MPPNTIGDKDGPQVQPAQKKGVGPSRLRWQIM